MNKFKKAVSITTAFMTIVSMSGVAGLASVASATTIVEGDLIKSASNPDVYVVKLVGSKMFKRLILSPTVFNSYGHLKWSNIKTVTDAEMNAHTTSELVRALGDSKVYKLTPNGDTGTKQWLNMTADAFTAAGYDWDSIYVINNTDRDSYTTGTDITSGTPSTGFSVALASDTVAAKTVPATASHVEFAKFAFSGNATITGLVLTRGGVGSTSDFDNVYLYDGNNRLTNGRTVNSSTNQVTFTGLSVAVSGSKTLTVVADVSATAGNTDNFRIAAATDVTATATVGGTFPVTGNTMTFATATAGTLTIAKTGSVSNPYVGASQAAVTQFTLAAASEDMVLKTLTFYNGGNLANSAITNLNLKIAGSTVATGTGFDSNTRGMVTFSGNGYTLTKGSTITATLYADLAGRPADTVKLYIENDVDVYAVGQTYGFGVQIVKTSFDTVTTDTHNLTMQGGQMTIAFNGPSSSTVGTDTNDTVLLDFSMTAASEIEVRKMRFYICYIDTVEATMANTKGEIEDIKVSEVGGSTIMGPVDGSSWTTSESASVCAATYTGGEMYYDYTDSFTMTAGQTKHLQLTADLKYASYLAATNILAGLVYNPVSLSNSMKYVSSNTYLTTGDVVPSTNVAGNQMTLAASSISVALGTSPTGAKTYVKGATGKEAAQFLFTAGQASDMTLTDLTLTGYVKDETGGTWTAGKETSGDTMYAKDLVSNVYLYDGSTLVAGPKGFTGTDYMDVVFDSLNVSIPAGTQKALTVKVDLTNTEASGTYDYVNFDIDDTTDVTTYDNKSTSKNPSSVDPNDSPTVYVLKADNGTLTTAIDNSYTPLSNAVYMSQTGVTMTKVRFTAATEAFTVQTLNVEIDDVADRTNIDKVSISYPTSSGSTSTATGYFGSTASITFSGLNFYVPKDNYAYLTILADMKSYTNGADSKDSFKLSFDGDGTSTTTFKAVGDGGTVIGPDHSGITDADGNSMYLYRSYPKFEILSSPAGGTVTSMPTTLAKFKVTNMGEYDMTFNSTSGQIKFEVVASGQADTDATFTLYDDDNNQALDTATITTAGAPAAVLASATFNFTDLAVTIGAGAPRNFRIEYTSGKSIFNENGDYLQLILRDEASMVKWVDNAATTQVANTVGVKGTGIPMNGPTWQIAGL